MWLSWCKNALNVCRRALLQTSLGELKMLPQITIISTTLCSDNLLKSKLLALEKTGKLWAFFSHFWPPCEVS